MVLRREAAGNQDGNSQPAQYPHTRVSLHRLYSQGGHGRDGPLGPVAKKFKNKIAGQRGQKGNRKIGSREDVRDRPGQAHRLSFSRARKLAHEKVGIE